MSLTSPVEVDFSMRPEDKALDFFSQPLDDPLTDLFDQYVNVDSFDFSDDNNEFQISFDLDGFFDAGTGTSSSGSDRISPIGGSARHTQSPQPWRKGLWCLNQNAASSTLSAIEGQSENYLVPIEPTSTSSVSLLNLEAVTNPQTHFGLPHPPSPATPPTTPVQKPTKNFITTPKTIRRRDPNGRQRLFRKASVSPSVMRPASYNNGEMSYQDSWTRQFQNLGLQVPEEALPLSPPPSTRLYQNENVTRLMVPVSGGAQNGNLIDNQQAMTSPHELNMLNQSHEDYLSSPSSNTLAAQRYLSQPATMSVQSMRPDANEALLSPHHSSEPQPIPSWTTESFDSTASGDYSYEASPDLNSSQTQAWWTSPTLTSATQPCPPHTPHQPYYPIASIAAPTPQRPTHSLLQTTGLHDGGLMIQYEAPPAEISAPTTDFAQSSASALPPNTATSVYPPHLPQTQAFAQSSPFSTPRRRQRTPPSRSPSISPTTTLNSPSAPRTRRRSSGHNKDSHRSNKQHSSSSTSVPTPKTPKTPSSACDFVNFTPSDSKKILTGVAPSGSSKTKARREQEAREKRRKLSEAALRAVRKAGGDVEALEAVLC